MAKRFGTRAGDSLPRVEKRAQSAGRGNHTLTGGLEVLQRGNEGVPGEGTVRGRRLAPEARHRDRPEICDGLCHLGRLHADLGETELGAQNVAKAYELRDRVSDRENYFITFTYHRQVTRNLELCRQTLESWTRKYPRDLYPSRILVGLHIARDGSLRQSRGRRSKGDRTRSGFRHRLRKCGFCLRLSEPPVRSRGTASQGIGTEDRSRSVLARPVLHRFSQERQGGNGTGSDPAAGETGSPGMVRAPGSSDVGVSRAPEGSGSAIGARGKPGSPGRVDGAGRHVSRRCVRCGMRCSGTGRRHKETRQPRCRFSEAGTPTMDLPLRWRFCGTPRKPTRSRRTSKRATRRIHLSSSVTCRRCGRSKRSTRMTRRKRSK